MSYPMQTSALIAPDCNQRPARAGLHSDQRFVTPLSLPSIAPQGIIRRIDVNKVIVGDCERVMATWPWNSVDLVVSSPPYDSMRSYRSGQRWHFLGVAYQLQRVLKPGGVLVWIVADETVNGSETGTSLNQALHFRELGLNLHDTMIWTKYLPGLMGGRRPRSRDPGRYGARFPVWLAGGGVPVSAAGNLDVAAALEVLHRAGFSLAEPVRPFRSVSVATAAERLECSQDWVRDHLEEFRGAFRLGSAIRIPEDDLERVARARRVFA